MHEEFDSFVCHFRSLCLGLPMVVLLLALQNSACLILRVPQAMGLGFPQQQRVLAVFCQCSGVSEALTNQDREESTLSLLLSSKGPFYCCTCCCGYFVFIYLCDDCFVSMLIG